MKVLAFILSTVVGSALLTGGAILIVLQSPGHSSGLDLLAILGLTILVYGPLALGSLTSYWDVNRSEGGRTFFRRYLWVVLALDVLAAVAIIVFSVSAGAEPWFPILFVGGGAVLLAAGLLVGRMLNRYEQAHPRPEEQWMPVSPREVQRKVVVVALTFVVVFVLGLVVFGWMLGGADDGGMGGAALFALDFASIAAALACIIVIVPLNRRLRSVVGGDLGSVRKVAKVVLGNKDIELDPAERAAAVKYAMIVPVTLWFSLGWVILLYIGIGLQQARQALTGTHPTFSIVLLAVLVAILIFAVPYYAVRIGRARRYARAHAGEIPSDGRTQDARTESR